MLVVPISYNAGMLYHAIDSAWLACADLDGARRPYERLGLVPTETGPGRASLLVGQGPTLFALNLVSGADAIRRMAAPGEGLFAVGLRVGSVRDAVEALAGRGVRAVRIGPLAWLPLRDRAGTDLVLLEADNPAPVPEHGLSLLRMDHLAAVTPDLEAKGGFWEDVLGVPVAGEVRTPTMVIRQLRIGNAVLELLAPASADSPLHQRKPGLVGMVSWEVKDLQAAVATARAAGFTVSEPASGPLPGTRISTIPGSELAGANLQLLQYDGMDRGPSV